ncbi:MAG: hypothetical protein JHC33_13345, partial [Ignisphaera sp.]|nr:hypothetical protein [Ignisphaera sp.]
MLRALIAILIIALLALTTQWLSPVHVVAEVDRHTPGFPKNITESTLPIPPLNISDIEKIVEDLYRSGAIGVQDYEKLRNLNNLSFDEAVSRIGNRDVAEGLQELRNKGTISPNDIEAFLNYLKSLSASGSLTPSDELLALKALETLSKAIGSPYTANIVAMMYSALSRLQSGGVRSFSAELHYPTPSTQQQKIETPSLPLPLIAFPQLPRVLPPIPSILREALAIAGIATAAIGAILILYMLKPFKSFRIPITLSREHKGYPRIGDPILDAYWRAVNLVSRVTSVERFDWETHREFL